MTPSAPEQALARLAELGLPALPEPLPRPIIDSHTHADSTTEMSGLDVETSLALAASVGVVGWVQVGCDVASSRYAVELAVRRPEVVAAVAVHPNDAARLGDQLDAHIAEIDALAASGPMVRAIGETGLDFFRTRDAEAQARQRHSFVAHLDIARRHDLTVVVHDRDAHQAVLDVLDAEGVPERLVMHCFSGDADFARQCLDRGAYLSFPGVVTFGSAGSLREAAKVVPLDRILVETDAPFLTPVPVRGRANAPYLVPYTARFLADLRSESLTDLCDAVVANTYEAFGGLWDVATFSQPRQQNANTGARP